ncbi:MAG: SIMPL domain-containing protein [Thaumarchaeota archaeon]|nr:SIMPL domain-containing protein [Nitrososphaerota archaeon]
MNQTKTLGLVVLTVLSVSLGIGLYVAAVQGLNTSNSTTTTTSQTRVTIDPVPAAPNSTVTVSGTGTVNFGPDRAMIFIGVTAQDLTATGAASADAARAGAIISSLNHIGITNDSIQTSSYNLNPNYSCCNAGPQVITGFTASQTLSVTVVQSDLNQLGKKVGQVIDTTVAAGANTINGIQFTVSDSTLQQMKAQALQLAVHDAASKANGIASAVGLKLTGIVSIRETTFSYPINYAAGVFAKDAASTPIIPPNSLSVSSSVEATYTIH